MSFEIYTPIRREKKTTFVKGRLSNGRLNLTFSKDVVQMISDTEIDKIKILIDKTKPRKILIQKATEKDDVSKVISIKHLGYSDRKYVDFKWNGYQPNDENCKTLFYEFEKYQANGSSGVLITLPE